VSPVELLVLGSLRYLGRGWTFNDCEESTAIDKDVHHCFFNIFIQFGSTVLYQKWVLTPVNLPEAQSNMTSTLRPGFPDASAHPTVPTLSPNIASTISRTAI
jgi:hypothetical protein